MRRYLLVLAFGLALGVLTRSGSAAPTEAPNLLLEFAVTPAAGPWMICAASYQGPDAPELARQLVLEIRNRHHMPAYIFCWSDQKRQQQKEELDQLQKLYPEAPLRRRTFRINEEYAVFIGGFPSDESASAALKKVRQLPLPDLKLEEGKTPYELMSVYEPDPEKKQTVIKRAPVNPFTTATVCHNPTVPMPKPENKPDPFLKELNSGEKFSVLRCPKRWTLVVKDYQGTAVIQPQSGPSSFLKMIGLGGSKPGEALNAAALQAHEVARVLNEVARAKQLDFEAYVLHTRHRSIVTVGAFDSLDDPRMQQVQRQLAALRFAGASKSDPIGLFQKPMPMDVDELRR